MVSAALRAMGILEGFEGWVVHDFLCVLSYRRAQARPVQRAPVA
ncbi:MAG: hypothetical protein R3F19_30675 [Verrucomicrobiales bacterium]